MPRPHAWGLIYLILAAVGLLSSFIVYAGVLSTTRQYYEALDVAHGGAGDVAQMASCDLLDEIRLISEKSDANDVRVTACDVMMYGGGVAVVGFLSFLFIWYCAVVVTLALVGLVRPRWKPVVLTACSLAFLFVALPVRPAIWLLELVLGLCFVWLLPLDRRLRACLMVAGLAQFYLLLGPRMTDACRTEFFSFSRLSLHGGMVDRMLPGLNDFLEGLHLGRINDVRGHDDGFPYAFVMLSLLIKLFRRTLRFTHELWTDRIPRATRVSDVLVYFLGLHNLVGEAATVSFRDMQGSRGSGPDSVSGARMLAWCLGFGSLAYCALVTLATSPAVRVLFPRCDIPTVGVPWLYARMITVFVIQYVFLITTSQASIAVARLFGYGLRENYGAALVSPNPAEFWRRWNIHWREFLVAVFYYPALLRLVRRFGPRQKTWHVYAATMITFLGTLVLNLAPLMLVSIVPPPAVDSSSNQNSATMREVRSATHPLASAAVNWRDTLPSLALYYAVDGAVVSFFLGLAMKRRAGVPRGRAMAAVAAVVATFVFTAMVRTLLDSSLSLQQQLALLARAVGFP